MARSSRPRRGDRIVSAQATLSPIDHQPRVGVDASEVHACGPVAAHRLDAMQLVADPLADGTIARVVGPWDSGGFPRPSGSSGPGGAGHDVVSANSEGLARIAAVNRAMAGLTRNGQLRGWTSTDSALSPDLARTLSDYLRVGSTLPDWADRTKIERAEQLFFEYGPLSCVLLFCASLPECYVVPDLADVLHTTGQLEQHTDYRVRSTAAMIFPVMMRGGLTHPDGGGIAQALKVRLIHATVRNLILRGSPEDAVERRSVISPLPVVPRAGGMHHALFARGWNVRTQGLPCNQEELAYTLLTFSYVFLRSLRQLGLALSHDDEEAYLHCWNVLGFIMGVRRELMADTMADAESLFALMQARGRAHPPTPDVRPALGQALMHAMQASIRLPVLRHFPSLMTYRLCGPQSAREIGVTGQAPWTARLLFALAMDGSRLIDTVMRLCWRQFSLSRLITRVMGYHVISSLLLDQTRPLKLPDHLIDRVNEHVTEWSDDPNAPRWVNSVEDALTVTGSWRGAAARRP